MGMAVLTYKNSKGEQCEVIREYHSARARRRVLRSLAVKILSASAEGNASVVTFEDGQPDKHFSSRNGTLRLMPGME